MNILIGIMEPIKTATLIFKQKVGETIFPLIRQLLTVFFRIRICALRHIILYYFINLWDWAPRRAIARCQKHHFQAEKLSLAHKTDN